MRTLKFIFILIVLVMMQACSEPLSWQASDITGKMPDLQFNLTGPDGEPVDADSLRGKPALVFFGFTNCPHICPTTLTRLSVIMKSLGSRSDRIQVVLISVDPGRDTPEVMKRYTESFGPWLLGLTGSESAITSITKSYGVYAAMESSDEKGSYNVMHSTAIFAFDANGHARLLITDVENTEAVVSDLTLLIEQ